MYLVGEVSISNLSVQGNVRRLNNRQGCVHWGCVWLGKCPSKKCPSEMCLVREMSFEKCPLGKCPSGKLPSGMCPGISLSDAKCGENRYVTDSLKQLPLFSTCCIKI